jgi:Uma2 family endonuclease
MSTAVAPPPLLTAEEYLHLPDDGMPTELVRGRRVEMNRPFTDHGYRMIEIASILRDYARINNLGRVVGGDAGVVTRRNPDTVRGPDIAFYSYGRVPEGPTPKGYWPTPELVVEILSPTDRSQDIDLKVSEYLDAGILCVLVIDPTACQVQVYTPNALVQLFSAAQTLTLSAGLPGFTVPVQKLFD